MSHENTRSPLAGAKPPGPLDNETALVSIDGKYALQISLPNIEMALNKKKLIDLFKYSFEEDDMFASTYLLSSNYTISIKGSNIIIEGPLKELIAAIHRLNAYGYHICQQKRDELLDEITQIHIREVSAQERQKRREKRKALEATELAKKEERIREKYTPMIVKHGMDPNIAFASLKSSTKTGGGETDASVTTPRITRVK